MTGDGTVVTSIASRGAAALVAHRLLRIGY
jgi:hypothetical protein